MLLLFKLVSGIYLKLLGGFGLILNCVFLLRRKFYLSFHHSHHDKDCSQRFTPDVMELIRIMVLTCVMEYRVKSCYGVSWCTDHLHGSQTLSAWKTQKTKALDFRLGIKYGKLSLLLIKTWVKLWLVLWFVCSTRDVGATKNKLEL